MSRVACLSLLVALAAPSIASADAHKDAVAGAWRCDKEPPSSVGVLVILMADGSVEATTLDQSKRGKPSTAEPWSKGTWSWSGHRATLRIDHWKGPTWLDASADGKTLRTSDERVCTPTALTGSSL